MKILMVCTGNICRSPTAEIVLKKMAPTHWRIASAGTHDYHVGDGADPRTVKAAKKRGYDLSEHSAQQLQANHYAEYDLLLAMDQGHLKILLQLCPSEEHKSKLKLFSEVSEMFYNQDVPDPYYKDHQAFEDVLDHIEETCKQWILSLTNKRAK